MPEKRKNKNLDDTHRLLERVRRFRRWMLLQQSTDRLTGVLLALSGVLLAWLWADKLVFLAFPDWTGVLALYAAAFVMTEATIWLSRPGLLRVAVALDRAANSRERLSSALQLRLAYGCEPDGRWKAAEWAVWRDARHWVEAAGKKQWTHWRPPKRGQALILVGLALGLSAFAPRYDLLGRRQAHQRQLAQSKRIKKKAARVERMVQKIQQRADEDELQEVKKITKQLEQTLQEMQHRPPSPREALKRLSQLERRVQDERQKLDPAKRALEQMEANPLTRKMAEALKQGDLQTALKEAQQLEQKIADGSLSLEEQRELRQTLNQTLDAAKSQGDLAQSDSRRGLQSGENEPAGSFDEQELSEALKAQFGELCENMGDLGNQALSSEQMGDMLALMQEFKSGIADSGGEGQRLAGRILLQRMNSSGKGQSQGRGKGEGQETVPLLEEEGSTNLDKPGGPGRSWSSRTLPPAEYVRLYDPRRTELEAKALRSRSALGLGPILGSVEVQSRPGQEEIKTPYQETFESFRSVAEDALDQEQVPLKYRPIVRRYFDTVDAVAEEGRNNP